MSSNRTKAVTVKFGSNRQKAVEVKYGSNRTATTSKPKPKAKVTAKKKAGRPKKESS